MANNYFKKCRMSLVTRELQSKTTLRYSCQNGCYQELQQQMLERMWE